MTKVGILGAGTWGIALGRMLCRSGCEIYQKKISCSHEIGARVRLYGEKGFFALGEVREYPEGTAVKSIKTFEL